MYFIIFDTLYPRKLILYHTGRYDWYIPYRPPTDTDIPFVSYWKKYRPYRLHTGRTDEILLFRLVNAYLIETRKRRRKKKKRSHSLISPLTDVTCSFLPQTPYLLDRRSPSLFQIYFLFSLSSFFFLLSWLRPMYAK